MKRTLSGRIQPSMIFFSPDGDGVGEITKGEVHISAEAKKFAGRFKPPEGMMPVAQKQQQEEKPPENETPEARQARELQEADRKKQEQQQQQQREPKKKGFVPDLINKNKELEEKSKRLEETLVNEKANYDKQIGELQKKIDSGEHSPAKEKQFQDQIDALTKDKTKTGKELEDARARLRFYNLMEDPTYVKEYITPIKETENIALRVVGDNAVHRQTLQRAMLANQQALSTNDEATRQQFERDRDTLLDNITESLPSSTARRLNDAMEKFWTLTEKQRDSLSNHEQTSAQIRKQADAAAREASNKVLGTWRQTYDNLETEFADDFKIDQETSDKIKELGIKIDPEADKAAALRAISATGSIEESCRMIHAGRVRSILNAKIAVKNQIIKELLETIEGYKGSGTGGGSGGGSGGGNGSGAGKRLPASASIEEKRKDFNLRFRPPVG